MLTYRQAAHLSARVRFQIIYYDEKGRYDMNNVVRDLPLDQLIDKIEIAEPDWYTFAVINYDEY